VRSALLPVLSTTEEQVVEKEKSYLASEFNRLGGLENLTDSIANDFDQKLIQKFTELSENPLFNSGISANGQPYSFTDIEKSKMKEQVALFAPQLKEQIILNEIKALSGENFSFEQTYGQATPTENVNWSDSTLTEQLASVLLKRFQRYALSHSDKKIISDITLTDGTTTKIELPLYLYPQVIRVASSQLFMNGHDAIEWAFAEKNQTAFLFEDEFGLLGETDKIDLSKLDKNTLKWILNNKQIAIGLGN
jgi:hypothetical protein